MSTPSKELLSAVFNTTVKNIELDRGQTEVKIYRENTSCLGTYNIYELVHKCKEWGFKQGYQIQILFQDGSTVIEVGLTGRGFEYREWCQKRYEPQMLIRACEWILSQTKLQ